MNITERIIFAREYAQLNTVELAKLMDITPQAVQNWEYGKSAPKRARLKKLAEVLNVSEEWLIAGVGSFKKEDTTGDEELDTQISHMLAQLKDDEKGDIIKLIENMVEQRRILDKYGM